MNNFALRIKPMPIQKKIRITVTTDNGEEFSVEFLASPSFNKLLAPHYGAVQVLDEIERLAEKVL
jgi:hypothetical protein